MDTKAKNKAQFCARLNAQKKEKRINSPLQYNEIDQPVCKICDCVLKSESIWLAHQLSRKQKEAVANLKATASEVNQVKNATAEAHPELELEDPKLERAPELLRPQTSSRLPPGVFDNQSEKRSTG